MIVEFLTIGSMTHGDAHKLASCFNNGREFDKLSMQDVLANVALGNWHCFRLGDSGLMAISVQESNGDRKLMIEAFFMPTAGWSFKFFTETMKRLATSYNCAVVETVVYDDRLATALKMHGCTKRAEVLELEVQPT